MGLGLRGWVRVRVRAVRTVGNKGLDLGPVILSSGLLYPVAYSLT